MSHIAWATISFLARVLSPPRTPAFTGKALVSGVLDGGGEIEYACARAAARSAYVRGGWRRRRGRGGRLERVIRLVQEHYRARTRVYPGIRSKF